VAGVRAFDGITRVVWILEADRSLIQYMRVLLHGYISASW
jgi:hypothetical protein